MLVVLSKPPTRLPPVTKADGTELVVFSSPTGAAVILSLIEVIITPFFVRPAAVGISSVVTVDEAPVAFLTVSVCALWLGVVPSLNDPPPIMYYDNCSHDRLPLIFFPCII
mgnify:FL=1